MAILPKIGPGITLDLVKSLGDSNEMHVFFLKNSHKKQKFVS